MLLSYSLFATRFYSNHSQNIERNTRCCLTGIYSNHSINRENLSAILLGPWFHVLSTADVFKTNILRQKYFLFTIKVLKRADPEHALYFLGPVLSKLFSNYQQTTCYQDKLT